MSRSAVQDMARDRARSDLALAAIAPLVWGSTYIVTTSFLPSGHPLTIAFWRALPAGVLLLLVARRLPTADWWWRSLVLGGLNIALFLAMLFVAAHRLPGGVAATVLSSQPLVVVLLLHFAFREPQAPHAIAGALLGISGVALLVLTPAARLDAVGVAAGIAGAVAMGLGTVLARRWRSGAPPLATTSWQLCAGGLWLAIPALVLEPEPFRVDTPGALALGYLALVGGAVTYVLWFRGLGRLPATAVSSLALLSPVSATVLGWALLDQRLGPAQLAGLALTIAGIRLSQRTPRHRPDRLDGAST